MSEEEVGCLMAFSSKCSSGPLDELLEDPLIRLVMQADKVEASQIRALVDNLGQKRQLATSLESKAARISIQSEETECYRSGIGIMLLNQKKEILLGRRLGEEDAWQMPQGGIEVGESPFHAALRELREEIGTDRVHLLAVSKGWLRYYVPPEHRPASWRGRWFGQQQRWFTMYFHGTDQDINVTTEHPEFIDWRWASPAEATVKIIDFKRPLYRDVLAEFSDYHGADVGGSNND